tara:strand:+ start:458 stop:2491 length:2034 start_codon:yes stop_codon:yes gene_type:complete
MAKLPEDKRARESKELFRRWGDARQNWDRAAREDIDFYLGNHYTKTEDDDLSSRNQSNLTIDRLYSAIEQMKAQLTAKPPKFSVVGREDSDNKMATVWKTILEYIWDISDGDEVFKQVVHDYAVTGLGYFYGYIDREADYGRGEVKFSYVDPFRVVVDPNARDKYFGDATDVFLSTILTKGQLLNLYPELDQKDEDGNDLLDSISDDFRDQYDYPAAENYRKVQSFTPDVTKDYDWETSRSYRVLERFTKVKVPYYRMNNKMAKQEKILDEEQFQMYMQDENVQGAMAQGLIDFEEVKQNRVRVICSVGEIVLYEYILNTDVYPVVPVPNVWTNTPYPMSDVRKCRDMQKFVNKMFSLLMAHAQSSAGLKLLIPTGSIQDIESLEQDWANPNATIEYDPSFGEPHFPAPQPLSSSVYQIMQQVEGYMDLNMGIFELQQGNAEVAPATASATMQIEDFGARRIKSKLRDVEGSLKRLGKVIYNLSKGHYTYEKSFRVVQPNNDINEFTVNFYDDKTNDILAIHNDINIGQYDLKVEGNSTLPSNRWGEWAVYMEAYKNGLIDQQEALKKTEIFDKQGVLERTGVIQQLESENEQLQKQIKDLQGDLQTSQRESVSAKQRTEVEKFKSRLTTDEASQKSNLKDAINKAQSAVKLEVDREKLRNQDRASKKKSQKEKKGK